jgi:hypothetical protein
VVTLNGLPAYDKVQHVPLRRGDRSNKESSRINTRTVLKSATRDQPLASPRPTVTAKSLSVNKLLLVGRKLKRFFPTFGNFVAKVSGPTQVTSTYTEPLKYEDSLVAPDRVLWKAALDLEYQTLERMGCWRVVKISTLPPDIKPISCKWVLKLKYANGVYEKHKGHIVARGFEQRKGVDYFQSFSPTVSQVSLRLVLTLTVSPGFLSVDLDATSAFISAPLQDNEQVYMTAVPGYPLPPGHCLHVVKSIYGLAIAPLAF